MDGAGSLEEIANKSDPGLRIRKKVLSVSLSRCSLWSEAFYKMDSPKEEYTYCSKVERVTFFHGSPETIPCKYGAGWITSYLPL